MPYNDLPPCFFFLFFFKTARARWLLDIGMAM
jgi:hypothetical protein